MIDRPAPAFWQPEIRSETRPDGTLLVWRQDPLGPHARCITDRLLHWADAAPDRTWMAERGPDGAWQGTSYGTAARLVRAIGATLLGLGLGPDRPLLILSGNSVAHGLMALGAQHVGIPSAALAPAYALASGDHAKLRDIVAQLTPGLVFAEDLAPFAPAIAATLPPDVPIITRRGAPPCAEADIPRHTTAGAPPHTLAEATQPTPPDAPLPTPSDAPFDNPPHNQANTPPQALPDALTDRTIIAFDTACAPPSDPAARAADAAHAAITPDTVAKFLFTSGTTGTPKAVIQTQRMICANQEMVANCYPFMRHEPPVVIDWAPWNHTASGNKVFNMVISNGGTFYIDDGRPTPADIGRTIRNLKDISPTWYFNVPLGYQMLLDAMEGDADLCRSFFARLKVMMYAGAGMSQPVWDRITRITRATAPGRALLCTGFGATETGPFCLMCTEPQDRAGNLGIPAPGVVLKLVPHGDRYEARVKSPSVTPGYWRAPELTARAFDDEGFYCFGDAMRPVDPARPEAGFRFDGRLAENFKLASGTWVAVGTLRARLLDDLGGLASDVVIAGEGHDSLGALVVPDWAAVEALARAPGLDRFALLDHPRLRRRTAELLADHARRAGGSATRVMRLMFLEAPLSFDRGEVTDKGSVNQRAVLRHRADLVDRLWTEDPRVIALSREQA
ncbi:feruloyl-CoA synthase [Marinibacterium sp. SX1]|uniref:feruloyl-CoA synthase n=1 Tax=Marinibacterium sp. SX1 TaxID=3388424 RepID=UPI003D167362